MQRPWIRSLEPWATARLRSNAVRWGKQMKTFLWIAIVGSVLAVLTANGAPQPLASPAAPAQAECKCGDLKALQIELRNAIRLQQAMRNKIPELRKLDHTESWNKYNVSPKTMRAVASNLYPATKNSAQPIKPPSSNSILM